MAAVATLAAGVVLALVRPPPHMTKPRAEVAAPAAPVVAAPRPALPVTAPVERAPAAPAVVERPAKPAASPRRAPRAERRPPTPDTTGKPEATEPVRRGLLPPRSPEAYPEQ
jgi:hypothetical protein